MKHRPPARKYEKTEGRSINMTAKGIALCLLCASFASAQYRGNYVQGVTDITSYATSGANAWKLLGGNLTCQANSFSIGGEGQPWCIGTDHYIYSWVNQVWTKQTAMGSSFKGLAVQDANSVWTLQVTTFCNTHAGYGIFHWGGTAWVQVQGCLSQLAIGEDGTLFGVNLNSNIWESTDGGNTWTLFAQNGGWTYASLSDQWTICAINAGKVYWLVSGVLTLMSPQPTGTTVGCAIAQDDYVFMAWSTVGAVSLYNTSSNTWQTVSGLAANSLATSQKAETFGLDSAGHPYHWNVYAAYIYGAMTGSWSGCPGPGNICKPGVTHTGTMQVYFPHGLNGIKGTWTGAPTDNMNATSWDASASCDPLFGNPNDPECTPSGGGTATCNQTGSNIGNAGNPPQKSYSHDYGTWNTLRSIGLPVQIGKLWWTSYKCYVDRACTPATLPVCENASYAGQHATGDPTSSSAAAAAQCLTGPWSFTSVYLPNLGAPSCVLVARDKHVTVPGKCD